MIKNRYFFIIILSVDYFGKPSNIQYIKYKTYSTQVSSVSNKSKIIFSISTPSFFSVFFYKFDVYKYS